MVPGQTASSPRAAAVNDDDIPLEELQRLRLFAADLIVEFGDWVLPIFERLDRECEARERRISSLDRARAMAGRR